MGQNESAARTAEANTNERRDIGTRRTSDEVPRAINRQRHLSAMHSDLGERQQQFRNSPSTPRMEQLPFDLSAPEPTTFEEEEAIKKALSRIAKSFSPIHRRLLNLAIGKCTIRLDHTVKLPSRGPLSPLHMRSMAAMAEMEFLESLKKELNHPEEKDASNPLPFDIYLMEPSLYRSGDDLRGQIALCVPMRKIKEEPAQGMMWYDGQGNLWGLDQTSHIRKISSLSGTVRVIEALIHPVTPLMQHAMMREMILDSGDVSDAADSEILAELNPSQREAVASIGSEDFHNGFFCVLGKQLLRSTHMISIHTNIVLFSGPPGTGKTHTITSMLKSLGRGIIVTAPSNAAVANLALKAHASRHFDMERLVVFGQNCDESVRFLNPLHRSTEYQKFMKSYKSLKEENEIARERKRLEFVSWLKLDEDFTIPDLARLCPFIDLDERSGRKLYDAILGTASIIFCTLNSSGSNMLRNAIGGTFSTFILDEAGQCSEAGM